MGIVRPFSQVHCSDSLSEKLQAYFQIWISRQMTSAEVMQQRTRRYLDEMDPDFRADLEEAFTLFDRMGDGQIDAQELSNLLRSLGQNPKREEVQQLVLEMDIDNSGSVDMEEFL